LKWFNLFQQKEIPLKIKSFKSTTLIENEEISFEKNKTNGDKKYHKEFYHLIKPNNSYTIEKSKLYTLSDVYVLFPYGIIFKDDDVLDESLYNVNVKRLQSLSQKKNKVISLRGNIKNAICVNEPSFLMAGGFSNNYYHWHTDILPRLGALEKMNVSKLNIYFSEAKPYQLDSLKYLKDILDDHHCKFALGKNFLNKHGRLYKFKTLYYTPFYMGKYPKLSNRLTYFYDDIKNQISSLNNPKTKNIYITRGNNKRRKLLNEKKLISALKKRWEFLVVNPEEHTYEEQIKMFSNCEIMIGPHGAGFTNMIFSSTNATVIELFPDTYLNIGLQRLALAKGLNYYYIVGKTLMQDSDNKHKLQYEINIDEVVNQMEKIID